MDGVLCCMDWVRDVDHEKRRYKKTGGLRNVDMEKNGDIQLDRTYYK